MRLHADSNSRSIIASFLIFRSNFHQFFSNIRNLSNTSITIHIELFRSHSVCECVVYVRIPLGVFFRYEFVNTCTILHLNPNLFMNEKETKFFFWYHKALCRSFFLVVGEYLSRTTKKVYHGWTLNTHTYTQPIGSWYQKKKKKTEEITSSGLRVQP